MLSNIFLLYNHLWPCKYSSGTIICYFGLINAIYGDYLCYLFKYVFNNLREKTILLKIDHTLKAPLIFLFLAAWVLLVFYPNPGNLTNSIYRLYNPPVMPYAVTDIAKTLEYNSPCEIKEFVYGEIPYRFDWETYNMPWYFPTLEEALYKGSGDCKARFLLFASILEELEIPYTKNISLTHIWVDYEGKPENTLENYAESLIIVDREGRINFSLPRPDLHRSMQNFYRGFWKTMPADKKLLLLAGFSLTVVFFNPRYKLKF